MSRGWRPLVRRRRGRRRHVRARAGAGLRAVGSGGDRDPPATPSAARRSSRASARAVTGTAATGGVGPALVGAGPRRGSRWPRSCSRAAASCPPGIVSGQEQADVVAYVVSISDSVRVGSRRGGRGSHRPPAARRDVRHRARGGRLRGRRARLAHARGRHRATARRRRSTATTSRRQSAQRFVDDHGRLVGDDPFALEDIGERLASIAGEQAAKAALDAALHDLQGKLLGVPAFKLLGLPRTGPPTSWTIWLGDPDDMARRAEKAVGVVSPAQAQARRRRRARRRARSRRARRHRAAADGRRQRVVVARGGARRAAAARRARRRVLRAAAEGGRRRRARAQGSLADPDLRRRGLPHARRRRRGAPRSRTASTSSSRSRAASARRSASRTPRGRCAWA